MHTHTRARLLARIRRNCTIRANARRETINDQLAKIEMAQLQRNAHTCIDIIKLLIQAFDLVETEIFMGFQK